MPSFTFRGILHRLTFPRTLEHEASGQWSVTCAPDSVPFTLAAMIAVADADAAILGGAGEVSGEWVARGEAAALRCVLRSL